jgi:hypothetical protein
MVTVEFRTGNLFEQDDLDALADGVNCVGAMGALIAVEFRRRWPAMYAEYRRCCVGRTRYLRLGGIMPWYTGWDRPSPWSWVITSQLNRVPDRQRPSPLSTPPFERCSRGRTIMASSRSAFLGLEPVSADSDGPLSLRSLRSLPLLTPLLPLSS